jgi:hypothetical protein
MNPDASVRLLSQLNRKEAKALSEPSKIFLMEESLIQEIWEGQYESDGKAETVEKIHGVDW